jgi:hypothetical protein
MADGCACCDVGVLGRRGLLTGASALTAAGLFRPGLIGSATAADKPFRIDVHHHITPPTWLEAVKTAKLDNPPMVNWSPEKSLEDMDKGGVATAMTSPTTPQLGFLPAADAARIARESNEYARKVANDHPGRSRAIRAASACSRCCQCRTSMKA